MQRGVAQSSQGEPGVEQDQGAAPATTDADLERARELFEQGIKQVEAADWVSAEQSFRGVLAIKSSPVVSYNLASALARLGRLIESAELLRVVVRDPAVDAATRDPAQQLLAEIEPQIGSLTVRVQGDIGAVALDLDGRPLGQEPAQTISVDPGDHLVTARRSGKPDVTARVSVGGDASLKAEVMLDLREPVAAPPQPDLRVSQLPEEREPKRDRDGGGSIWSSPWLWAGAGAVVIAGAVIIIAAAGGGGGGDPGMSPPIEGDTDPPVIHGTVQSLLRGGL